MIDDSIRDLINRHIDGVCTPEEKERLQGILRTNDEARRMHEDLLLLASQLAAVTPVEPPRTLKPAILRAIDARHRPARTTGPVTAWLGGWSLRHVLAGAAGAVAGIAITIAVNSTLFPPTVTDVDLAGTLILHGSAASFTQGPVTKMNWGETSATIETHYSTGLCFLKLNVSSSTGVSATFRVDPALVSVEGIRPLGTPSPSVSVKNGEVLVEHAEAGGFAILVAGNTAAIPAGRLILSVGGTVVYDEDIALVRR
jgi:hypothetical protein